MTLFIKKGFPDVIRYSGAQGALCVLKRRRDTGTGRHRRRGSHDDRAETAMTRPQGKECQGLLEMLGAGRGEEASCPRALAGAGVGGGVGDC